MKGYKHGYVQVMHYKCTGQSFVSIPKKIMHKAYLQKGSILYCRYDEEKDRLIFEVVKRMPN